jgi:hypothetical protein
MGVIDYKTGEREIGVFKVMRKWLRNRRIGERLSSIIARFGIDKTF